MKMRSPSPRIIRSRQPKTFYGAATGTFYRSSQWFDPPDAEFKKSNYAILLLSPQAAVNEVLTEAIAQAKAIQQTRQTQPILIPIEITISVTSFFNFDLRDYLKQIPQDQWRSPADTSYLCW